MFEKSAALGVKKQLRQSLELGTSSFPGKREAFQGG